MICLLDLNYTLVSNSDVKHFPFSKQIAGEEYREDLLKQLQKNFKHIFLLTARPQKYEAETLQHLWEKLRWKPNDWYFNFGAMPHIAKEHYLINSIFPKYGNDPDLYFGLESNPKTRDMYKTHGIKSVTYQVYLRENYGIATAGELDIQKSACRKRV